MYSADEVREKINMYIYMMNKYNVYGVLATMILGWYMGVFVLPPNSGFKNMSQIAGLLLVCCFLVKYALLVLFRLRDVCECKLDEKDFIHPKRETCPKEESIFGVYNDLRYVIEETLVNVGFRYNVAALILILVICTSFGLMKTTTGIANPFNLAALLLTLVLGKMALNYFFMIQDYCPCACRYKAPKLKPQCSLPTKASVSKEVDLDIKDAKQGKIQKDDLVELTNRDIDRMLKESKQEVSEPIVSDLEKEIEKEIRNMMPNKNLDDRLKDMCRIASEKLRRYDTVDACLRDVHQNADAKEMAMKMMTDDKAYTCLQSSNSSAQYDACFRDYFSRHPQFLLRLVDAFPDDKKT